jgi:hypothetical protein
MQTEIQAAVQALMSALSSFIEQALRWVDSAVELLATGATLLGALTTEWLGTTTGRQLLANYYAGLERMHGRSIDDQWLQVASKWSKAY